jgi:hypothetical protein
MGESVHSVGEHEVQRAQAEYGEGVRGEHDEDVRRDAEDGRDRIHGKDEIDGLDDDEGEQEGRRCPPALVFRDEASVVAGVGDGDEAPDRANKPSVLDVDLAPAARKAQSSEEHEGAKGVEGPTDALDERGTGCDEGPSHHERAEHPPRQNAALVGEGHLETPKHQSEREHVVDAERLLEKVAGEVLSAGRPTRSQGKHQPEGARKKDPPGALYERGAQALEGAASMEDDLGGQ